MNIEDILSDLNGLVNFKNIKTPIIAPPLILSSKNRKGLSSIEITQRILKIKQQLNLPVGTLPDGSPNLDDIMIGVIVKEIIDAFQTDARVAVAVEARSGLVQVQGTAGVIPVVAAGTVSTTQTGWGIIQ